MNNAYKVAFDSLHSIMDLQQARETVRDLFQTQAFAVLATRGKEQPYTTLVAFTPTDDMQKIVFATERTTTKFAHIKRHPRVSMLIDNRTNHPRDFSQATVVTLLGEVSEIPETHKEGLLQRHITKHPYLEEFVRASSSALMKLTIYKVILVTRFQHVVEWGIDECIDTPR